MFDLIIAIIMPLAQACLYIHAVQKVSGIRFRKREAIGLIVLLALVNSIGLFCLLGGVIGDGEAQRE